VAWQAALPCSCGLREGLRTADVRFVACWGGGWLAFGGPGEAVCRGVIVRRVSSPDLGGRQRAGRAPGFLRPQGPPASVCGLPAGARGVWAFLWQLDGGGGAFPRFVGRGARVGARARGVRFCGAKVLVFSGVCGPGGGRGVRGGATRADAGVSIAVLCVCACGG